MTRPTAGHRPIFIKLRIPKISSAERLDWYDLLFAENGHDGSPDGRGKPRRQVRTGPEPAMWIADNPSPALSEGELKHLRGLTQEIMATPVRKTARGA